jgi:hypothetical protein
MFSLSNNLGNVISEMFTKDYSHRLDRTASASQFQYFTIVLSPKTAAFGIAKEPLVLRGLGM